MQNDADDKRKSDWHRRLGRFIVHEEMLDDNPLLVFLAMQRCIVVRCEHMYVLRAFDYMAISPDFAVVPPGMMIPEYTIIVDHREGCVQFMSLEKET